MEKLPTNSRKLTIILPLWDRSQYTHKWLQKNIFTEFDYVVADGSLSHENQEIFENQILPSNIKYLRYPPDISIDAYVEKMFDVATQIKTPYVMTCDNDDILNYEGVIECLNVLENSSMYGFCNGAIQPVQAFNQSTKLMDNQYFRPKFLDLF
jgi:glycosyltransferase domain-containing protein